MPLKYRAVTVHKAQGITEKNETYNLELTAKIPFPNCPTIEESDMIHQHDAEKLEVALYNTLAGGTYDRLLGRMLERKASHFIVSFGSRE